MRVAFCTSEAFPFAKSGGLADVCGALPRALGKHDIEVVLFLPKYGSIDRQFIDNQVAEHLYVSKISNHFSVYLIEHKEYFDRPQLYGDENGDYADNFDRFHHFCKEVFESLKHLNLPIDILHCHDWQTGLIPLYLKEKYKYDTFFKETKAVLTIHNLAFQGVFSSENFSKIDIQNKKTALGALSFFDQINLLKSGIIYSDEINTVSPQYAREIQTEKFGCGLQNVMSTREKKVRGILNGLDEDVWDPKTDQYLTAQYSSEDYLIGKGKNKAFLQEKSGLALKKNVPLFGFVGRLTHQKGVDLLLNLIKNLTPNEIQIVVQGMGSQNYHEALQNFSKSMSRSFAYVDRYDESMAHNIYAASDIFLMPSEFEPCGLTQMISMKYGTLPLVYKTGGLVNTVKGYDEYKNEATGFMFNEYDIEAFIKEVKVARDVYQEPEVFHQLLTNAFAEDFSWDKSAKEYSDLYQCLLSD